MGKKELNSFKDLLVWQKAADLAAVILFSLIVFLFPLSTSAAEIIVSPGNNSVSVGQQFEVGVFLNAAGDDINAIQGKIIFPADLLKLESINDGNSILNYWVDRPKEENGQISFSGITPGGYNGEQGLIFSAIFSALKTGNGEFSIKDAAALLNDGKGTAASMTVDSSPIKVVENNGKSTAAFVNPVDKTSPEEFSPQISRDSNLFNGKWFLVFAAQDKGSGIDHYSIQENRKNEINEKKWQTAESPYQLRDQRLKSNIYVKAVDKSGNFRVAALAATNPVRWYETFAIWCIIIMALAIIAGYLWMDRLKKMKKTR